MCVGVVLSYYIVLTLKEKTNKIGRERVEVRVPNHDIPSPKGVHDTYFVKKETIEGTVTFREVTHSPLLLLGHTYGILKWV